MGLTPLIIRSEVSNGFEFEQSVGGIDQQRGKKQPNAVSYIMVFTDSVCANAGH